MTPLATVVIRAENRMTGAAIILFRVERRVIPTRGHRDSGRGTHDVERGRRDSGRVTRDAPRDHDDSGEATHDSARGHRDSQRGTGDSARGDRDSVGGSGDSARGDRDSFRSERYSSVTSRALRQSDRRPAAKESSAARLEREGSGSSPQEQSRVAPPGHRHVASCRTAHRTPRRRGATRGLSSRGRRRWKQQSTPQRGLDSSNRGGPSAARDAARALSAAAGRNPMTSPSARAAAA